MLGRTDLDCRYFLFSSYVFDWNTVAANAYAVCACEIYNLRQVYPNHARSGVNPVYRYVYPIYFHLILSVC